MKRNNYLKAFYKPHQSRPFHNFKAKGSAVDKFRMISLGTKSAKSRKRTETSVKILSGLTIEVCRLNSQMSTHLSESPQAFRPLSTIQPRPSFEFQTSPKSKNSSLFFPSSPAKKNSKRILVTKIPQATLIHSESPPKASISSIRIQPKY